MPVVGAVTEFVDSIQQADPTFTFSHTHTSGAGHALLVLVGVMSGVTGEASFTVSATYDGDPLTAEVINNNDTFTAFAGSVRALYLQSPSTGSNTVSITVTSTQDVRCFCAAAISLTGAGGIGNSNGVERFGVAGDTSFDYDVTAASADSLIIGMHTVRGTGRTFTPGSGYTDAGQDDTGGSTSTDVTFLVQHRDADSVGAIAFDGTYTPNNRNAGGAVEIVPALAPVTASGTGDASSDGSADAITFILATATDDATSSSVGDSSKTIPGAGIGEASSTGFADAEIIFPANQATATSDGVADAFVKVLSSATGDAVSDSVANGIALVFASGTDDATSDSTGFAIRHILVSGTEDAASDGSATATEFSGVRGTGDAVSSSVGNASEPIPLIPIAPIEDSFRNAQRPFVMVDLFFDSGEVNIWTRPHVGEFNRRTYQPLAGVTDGLTIRNSLDDNALDAAVQFSGQSEEMLALALTESYQGRRAVVTLANIGDTGLIEAVEVIMVGSIVNMALTDDDDESTVSVLVESVFKSVTRPPLIRQSTPDLQRVSPGDEFFELVETASVTEPRFGGTS